MSRSWLWGIALAACAHGPSGSPAAAPDQEAAPDTPDQAAAAPDTEAEAETDPCGCDPKNPGIPPYWNSDGCGCEFGYSNATCKPAGVWAFSCRNPCDCDPNKPGSPPGNHVLKWVGCGCTTSDNVVCTPAGRWECAPDDNDAGPEPDALDAASDTTTATDI